MLDPMISWEDKEVAREAGVCHTQREGGGQGGETRRLSPHRGPASGSSGAGAARGRRPLGYSLRIRGRRKTTPSAPRAEGRLPNRRSGSSQDEAGALGPRCVGPQCRPPPPPPSRTDAWRQWKREVWARSREGRLGSQRGGTGGPGTGLLGEGQPGVFPELGW